MTLVCWGKNGITVSVFTTVQYNKEVLMYRIGLRIPQPVPISYFILFIPKHVYPLKAPAEKLALSKKAKVRLAIRSIAKAAQTSKAKPNRSNFPISIQQGGTRAGVGLW